jgi:hypothetical protein
MAVGFSNNNSPMYPLDVVGDINLTGTIRVNGIPQAFGGSGTSIYASSQFWGNMADSVSTPAFAWSNNTNTGMFHAGADTIGFTTAGTEKAMINAGGNVGIG